jgi:hypothetical protein
MRNSQLFLLIIITFLIGSCRPKDTKWKGQAPLEKVNTATRPIQYQLKKTYDLGNGVYLSNDFDGARMNGVALTDKDEVTVLITPENTPINPSPWYAFKIWSDNVKNIRLKITYNEGVGHRYYPKLSHDGTNWMSVDSTLYLSDTASVNRGEVPKFCEFSLTVNSDTTWIAAQELIVSKDIFHWSAGLTTNNDVQLFEIGKSMEGRPLKALQIGNAGSSKHIMVLSRQHPPEVTGWLAMKAFVERLCENDTLSRKFRNEYNIFVVPCVNPDGVDNGHWRHGAGGIDLNRDWQDFNQPETQAIRKFMQNKVREGGTFYFAIDFHSTYQDIYYTIAPELEGNMPGLVPKVITAMGEDIPGYDPNIRPNGADALRINSTVSIFHEFGAEAVTYEVGDGTPRDLIKKKGELTAENLMEIMLGN